MRAHEIHLQLRELVRRDGEVGEFAEARGHAVHRLAARGEALDDPARRRHASARRGRESHRSMSVGDRREIGDRERVPIEEEGRGHGVRVEGDVEGVLT